MTNFLHVHGVINADMSRIVICGMLYINFNMKRSSIIYYNYKGIKSHYLRASDSLNYGLEIEKIDFLEILPIFNFCQEMNKNAYFSHFFSLPYPWQPRFSIFSIFQQYFELKITIFMMHNSM